MLNLLTMTETEAERILMDMPELEGKLDNSFKDSFEFSTRSQSEFLNAAYLFGANRETVTVEVNNIVFKPMPGGPIELHDDFIGESDDVIEVMTDSQNSGTPLYVEIDGMKRALRNTACNSVFTRIGIGGLALDNITRSLLAKHMNEYASACKGKGLLIHNNRKVEALLGAGYRMVPAEDIMRTAAGHLTTSENFENVVFDSGYFTHTMADAQWFTGHVLVNAPFGEDCDKKLFSQTVRVSTSDCGTRAVTIAPIMKEVGAGVPNLSYCLPLQMEHKGSASVAKFHYQLELVTKRFEDSTKNILGLVETNLVYPANVLIALMKWLKIPAKYGVEVFEKRKVMWGNGERSAYDVYGSLSEVLSYVVAEEKSRKSLAEYQDRFARGLHFAYTEYDLPGSYCYNDKLIGMKGV